MFGLIALLMSLSGFFTVLLIDRFGDRARNSYVQRLWSSLHESLRACVLVYLICLVLIAASLGPAIVESQNEFLIEAFTLTNQILFWLVVTMELLLFTLNRFRRHVESPGEYVAVWAESAGYAGPAAGIDYIVSYMQDPQWGFPPHELELVLSTLSIRSDALGVAARAKMKELGLDSQPQ